MCENENASAKISLALLDYHHKAMEARRAIGFKAFLSLIALDLLILKGATEIRTAVSDLEYLKILVIAGYWVLCSLYTVFIFQIERVNRYNRVKYSQLEKHIWGLTGLTPASPPKLPSTESLWKTVVRSWAGTWPVLTIILFSLGCTLVVAQLKP